MSMKIFSAAFLCATGFSVLAGCASEDAVDPADDDLQKSKDATWLYTGPLSKLEGATAGEAVRVVASLKGHTAHVIGYLPAGTQLPDLPHGRTSTAPDGRLRVDLVYPIATAGPGASNSRPGTYTLGRVIPFRVDSQTTSSFGTSFVTWGGFPFIGYNNGIAFHGPITSKDNPQEGLFNVWYLQRGAVSHGCNRMNGEHVLELAHVLGFNMRKLYTPGGTVKPPTPVSKVDVIADYDKTVAGKYIDVDYPTDKGVTRPGVTFGTDKVEMFGSWAGSELPDGKDLPGDMAWEGGVSGKKYVFAEHVKQGWVCSMPKAQITKLTALAAKFPNKELPATICAKKACVVDAFNANKDAKVACGL